MRNGAELMGQKIQVGYAFARRAAKVEGVGGDIGTGVPGAGEARNGRGVDSG